MEISEKVKCIVWESVVVKGRLHMEVDGFPWLCISCGMQSMSDCVQTEVFCCKLDLSITERCDNFTHRHSLKFVWASKFLWSVWHMDLVKWILKTSLGTLIYVKKCILSHL